MTGPWNSTIANNNVGETLSSKNSFMEVCWVSHSRGNLGSDKPLEDQDSATSRSTVILI